MKKRTSFVATLCIVIFGLGMVQILIMITKIEPGFVAWLLVCQSGLWAGLQLHRRSRTAWWVLTAVSALGLVGCASAEACAWFSSYSNTGDLIVPLVLMGLFAVLLAALVTDPPAKWTANGATVPVPSNRGESGR